MAKNATMYQSVAISGDAVAWNIGSLSQPTTTIGNTVNYHMDTTLNSGFNTILVPQVPQPSVYMEIYPSPLSVVSKIIMGSNSDVGISLFANLPSRIALAASQTSVIIKAGGSETIDIYFY